MIVIIALQVLRNEISARVPGTPIIGWKEFFPRKKFANFLKPACLLLC